MEEIFIVYIGRTAGAKNTIVHKYLVEKTEEPLLFGKKLAAHSIGSIIKCKRNTTNFKGPYEYVGRIQDTDKINRWTNRDIATYDEYVVNRDASKKLTTKHDLAIQDLRETYKSLVGAQRVVFINRLILDITK